MRKVISSLVIGGMYLSGQSFCASPADGISIRQNSPGKKDYSTYKVGGSSRHQNGPKKKRQKAQNGSKANGSSRHQNGHKIKFPKIQHVFKMDERNKQIARGAAVVAGSATAAYCATKLVKALIAKFGSSKIAANPSFWVRSLDTVKVHPWISTAVVAGVVAVPAITVAVKAFNNKRPIPIENLGVFLEKNASPLIDPIMSLKNINNDIAWSKITGFKLDRALCIEKGESKKSYFVLGATPKHKLNGDKIIELEMVDRLPDGMSFVKLTNTQEGGDPEQAIRQCFGDLYTLYTKMLQDQQSSSSSDNKQSDTNVGSDSGSESGSESDVDKNPQDSKSTKKRSLLNSVKNLIFKNSSKDQKDPNEAKSLPANVGSEPESNVDENVQGSNQQSDNPSTKKRSLLNSVKNLIFKNSSKDQKDPNEAKSLPANDGPSAESLPANDENSQDSNQQIKDLNNEISALNEKINKLEDELESTQKKNGYLQDDKEKLEQRISDLNEQVKDLDQKVNSFEQTSKQLEDQVTEKDKEIKDLRTSKALTDQTLNHDKTEIDNLKKQIENLKSDKNRITQQTDQTEEINRLKQEASALNEKVSDLNGKVSDLNGKVTAKDAQITEKDKEISAKDEEINRLKQEVSGLNEQVTANQDLNDQNKKLQSQIADKDSKIEGLESKIKDLELEIKKQIASHNQTSLFSNVRFSGGGDQNTTRRVINSTESDNDDDVTTIRGTKNPEGTNGTNPDLNKKGTETNLEGNDDRIQDIPLRTWPIVKKITNSDKNNTETNPAGNVLNWIKGGDQQKEDNSVNTGNENSNRTFVDAVLDNAPLITQDGDTFVDAVDNALIDGKTSQNSN